MKLANIGSLATLRRARNKKLFDQGTPELHTKKDDRRLGSVISTSIVCQILPHAVDISVCQITRQICAFVRDNPASGQKFRQYILQPEISVGSPPAGIPTTQVAMDGNNAVEGLTSDIFWQPWRLTQNLYHQLTWAQRAHGPSHRLKELCGSSRNESGHQQIPWFAGYDVRCP